MLKGGEVIKIIVNQGAHSHEKDRDNLQAN